MAESSEPKQQRPRPDLPHKDAGLHLLESLSSDQRAAFAKAHVIFCRLAEKDWCSSRSGPTSTPSFVAEIEEERYCPNVLIDGGRGIGKTVVFLWLLEYWRLLHSRLSACSRKNDNEKAERARLDAAAKTLKDVLEEIALLDPGSDPLGSNAPPWIVPLRIIDLQPLPPTTDVSLLIGAGFRRVIEELRLPGSRSGPGSGRPDRCRGRFLSASDRDEIRTDPLDEAWDRFVFASAFGSQRLRERSARVDLETYRFELEDSQHGAGLALAFRELIDVITVEFADAFGSRGTERSTCPFFVIPIDDADMNPARTGELIWLLGTLRHPRVGFLLTGDSELLRDKVNETLRGGIELHDGGSGIPGRTASEQDADWSLRLGRVADAIVEKVLPPAHRCRLKPLRGVERKEQLKHALGLLAAPPSESKFEELFGPGEFTDFALPGTLRRCKSLESFIQELVASKKTDADPRLLVVGRLWKDRVREMSLPDPYWRFVRDAVRIREIGDEIGRNPEDADDPGGGILTIASDRLLSEPLSREVDGGSLARRTNRRFQSWSYSVREILDYRISLQVEKGSAFDFPLSDDVGAAFILASNLAAEAPRARFVGEPTCPRGAANPFVGVSFHWIPEGGTVRLRWPLPEWTSYRDAHRFQRLFLRAIRCLAPRGVAKDLDRYLVPFAATAAWVGLFRGFEGAACKKWLS